MERIERQFEFIREIDKEKLIERQSYLTGAVRKENDAEHAWHMALMVILLSEYANEEIDVLKTITMLLIHDIVEIDAGDTYAYDEESKKTQRLREEKAAKRIFGILPEDQGMKLCRLWEEFEACETPEAKFARTMDHIQPLMQNHSTEGKSWLEHGVYLNQVLKRNEKTMDGSRRLWDYAYHHFIMPNAANGILKTEAGEAAALGLTAGCEKVRTARIEGDGNMSDITIKDLYTLEETIAADVFRDAVYPWEILKNISSYIIQLGSTLDPARFEKRGENVWIAKTAKVAPSALINGPAIIDEEAEIRHCAFIRGSAVVGKGAVVGNSTELKNVILFNKVQVPHYNYVGDSILGYKAHMGAGSITSNVKSDKKLVVVHKEGESIETGLRKFGAMLGDAVEVGCNSVLNPGTIIGKNSNIYPLSSVRGVVPANHIFKNAEEITAKVTDGQGGI